MPWRVSSASLAGAGSGVGVDPGRAVSVLERMALREISRLGIDERVRGMIDMVVWVD